MHRTVVPRPGKRTVGRLTGILLLLLLTLAGNSEARTHPVKTKEPNGWGLYDMHGNLWEWEWEWDWYGEYPEGTQGDPAVDPTGCETGRDRVGRGGSGNDWAKNCRSASRGFSYPSYPYINVGFRLARSAE